jgi:hypothetical protein
LPKGCKASSPTKPPIPFDLNTVIDNQDEDRQRHAKGGVRVRGWHNPQVGMMGIAAKKPDEVGKGLWNQVNRQQVHQVHEEDPDKDGQGQGRDHGVNPAERAAHILFDEVDDPLGKILHGSRDARRDIVGDLLEEPEEEDAQTNGHKHCIDMDGPETHGRGLLGGLGEGQATIREDPEGKIGQMVVDIALRG